MEVQLVSPEQVLYTGEAEMVVARTLGGGEIAFTALWHDDDSLLMLRWRHCSASAPPGVTPEQFDM